MNGFTLLELMIVISIISIVAAIAIPNILEARVSANESAAAANLRSGFLPAQTQFHSATYSDVDGDGRGEYARDHNQLAGFASPGVVGSAARALALLSPNFNVPDRGPVGGYLYQIDTDVSVIDSAYSTAESYFGAYALPSNSGEGRRAFAINVIGVVYASKQTYPASALLNMNSISGQVAADNSGAFTSSDALMLSDPRIFAGGHNVANAVLFQK